MLSRPYADALTHCLGSKWAAYVGKKRIGGDGGAKGVRYEDYFAAFQLAKALCARVKNSAEPFPHLAQQADAIVDDVVLTWAVTAAAHYFQCKNVESISWTSGTHPLVDDFHAQAVMAEYEGIVDWKTLLVVPTSELKGNLDAKVPAKISSHSEVIHFPYCEGRLNRLVLECVELRLYLAELARVDKPTDDELSNVLGALVHGIRAKGGVGMSDEMLYGAQGLSPHLIRLMPDQMQGFRLEQGFEETLAKVRGLVYLLSKGFFQWEAMGTSGVFSQNCLSQEFLRFQRRVMQQVPTMLDEFEALL